MRPGPGGAIVGSRPPGVGVPDAAACYGTPVLAIQRFTAVSAIDGAFRVYRTHFRVLFTISLLINAPVAAANVALTLLQHRLERATSEGGGELLVLGLMLVVALLGVVVLGLVASMFGTAASTEVASRAATARPVELNDALAAALRSFWPLLGASLLTTLAIAFGMLFFLVPGVVLALGFAFVGPVIVLEGAGVGQAIERSWRLSRGRRLKILAVAALLLVVMLTTTGLLSLVQLLPELRGNLALQLGQTLATQAISVLFTPVWYVAMVLLYYDGRVEQEAFDVQVLSRAAPDPAP